MRSTYSVTQAQSQLPSLIRKAEDGEAVKILRHNETVAYLISRERMEAIVETMEFLSNPEAMKAIAAHRAGKVKFLSLAALGDDHE
jgi:prevent-host-death family protein